MLALQLCMEAVGPTSQHCVQEPWGAKGHAELHWQGLKILPRPMQEGPTQPTQQGSACGPLCRLRADP